LFSFKGRVDKKFLDELEKRLYEADLGTYATQEIVARVRTAYQDKEVTGEMIDFVKAQLKDMLNQKPEHPIAHGRNRPDRGHGRRRQRRRQDHVDRQARQILQDQNKKVMVAACDTFRAAAVEQLTIWSQRLGVEIVKNQQGSDPASVAHDACDKARAKGFDVVIVDTAGRLPRRPI